MKQTTSHANLRMSQNNHRSSEKSSPRASPAGGGNYNDLTSLARYENTRFNNHSAFDGVGDIVVHSPGGSQSYPLDDSARKLRDVQIDDVDKEMDDDEVMKSEEFSIDHTDSNQHESTIRQ